MDFSISSLIAGFIFGTLGLWMFSQGRKRFDNRIVSIGVLLIVYSFFTPTPFWTWSVGLGLCALAKYYW